MNRLRHGVAIEIVPSTNLIGVENPFRILGGCGKPNQVRGDERICRWKTQEMRPDASKENRVWSRTVLCAFLSVSRKFSRVNGGRWHV